MRSFVWYLLKDGRKYLFYSLICDLHRGTFKLKFIGDLIRVVTKSHCMETRNLLGQSVMPPSSYIRPDKNHNFGNDIYVIGVYCSIYNNSQI